MTSPAASSAGPSRVRNLRFADCDQLSEMISGGDASFFQLGAGSCKGSMRRIDFDGFYLLLTDLPNRTACHVASTANTRVVHLVDHWSDSLRWNGRDLTRTGVVVWGDSCDYYRVGHDVRTVGLVIDEARLRKEIETLAPSSQRLWDTFDGQMLADTPATRRFMKQVRWVVALAGQTPEHFRIAALRARIREALLLSLAEAVEAQGELVPIGSRISRQRSRIVSLMTDYWHEHPEEPIEISDLCRLTGSSARTVANACRTILDTSPMRYLKRLRLNRARVLLRDGSTERVSVAECAYSAGFAHLGRFSVEYREMFGESPHETLSRSD